MSNVQLKHEYDAEYEREMEWIDFIEPLREHTDPFELKVVRGR